jgi:hypothetical protein
MLFVDRRVRSITQRVRSIRVHASSKSSTERRRKSPQKGVEYKKKMRKMILKVVLLSLACSSSLAAISQRDLRSIFVHHQEFCRETVQRPAIGVAGETVQFRTSHSIQACKISLDHEWHINEANILDEAEFQTPAPPIDRLHHPPRPRVPGPNCTKRAGLQRTAY